MPTRTARMLLAVLLAATLFPPARAAGAPDDASAPDEAAGRRPPTLRVMTYNIHHGEGTDGRIDLPRIAKVITGARPDLVALQEVDVKTRRSNGVDQAAELGRLTGMRVSFGRAIDYQGGQYGQALLSRVPLQDFKVHTLPGDPEREQRCALSATVRPWGEQGPAVTFVGTHLHHLSEPDRLKQADEINRLFASDGGEGGDGATAARPTILVGDLNARPPSETMAKLLARWRDAAAAARQDDGPARQGDGAAAAPATYPADAPDRRIDYVLMRPTNGWRVADVRVIEERVASDHRPVVADLVRAPRDGSDAGQ